MQKRFIRTLGIKFFLYMLFCLHGIGYSLAAPTTLDVAVGWSKPPYIIEESDSGFELELVSKVMGSLGYQLNPVYVPFGRTQSLLENGEVDLTLTVNHSLGINSDQLSDVYVVYQNVAITLKQNNINISRIADLEDYSIVAFQNASMILGRQYNESTSRNHLYLELPDQKNQVEMLFQESVDVIVMDVNIFNHLSKKITGKSQKDKVRIHPLFPQSRYRVGFLDTTLKFKFNKALAQFVLTPEYEQLNRKYDLYSLGNTY